MGVLVVTVAFCGCIYCAREIINSKLQCEKKKDSKEIVWITESSLQNVCTEMETEFNELLKKRGGDYRVRFMCFPMETYEEDVEEYLENNSADIIYSNLRVVGDDNNQFYSFYKKGYLENLDKVRLDVDFYAAYPEETWETMEINGEIYGIPTYSNVGNGLYYVFNKEYLYKHNIDLSEVTDNLETVYPLLVQVAEGEKDNESFIPMLSYEYMIYAPGYTELLDTIRIKETGTMPVAENLLENQYVKDTTLLLNKFHEQGLLAEGKIEVLTEGNFFVTVMCADESELIQKYIDAMCEEQGKQFLSLEFIKVGEHYTSYRTGGMNSVIKGENTEKALEILKKTVTDKEISDLLKYGSEDMEEIPIMLQWMFGNDRWDKKGDDVVCSSIAGFQFDGSEYKEQIDQLSKIYYSYSDLFRGLSENPQEEYKKLTKEMKIAGIDEVVAEVNVQLEQWYKGKKK